MAKGMTMNVLLALRHKEFVKGLKRVEASLNRFKMKFKSFTATMGAGLGVGIMFREMAENAKRMDQASTTLKNVSKNYTELADSQKFLMDISDRYNQELIGLTENFAKFHSSADQANMSMDDQKKVFESLARASAFFNLTADETNGVMLAITQMMSKGRVASEELRRQLGERLPGSFGLMASALGMTTAELEDAMRKGEVMAADALPKLATELNKLTNYLNVDTIQGQTNRVKNAFTQMVKAFNIKGAYKSVLKGLGTSLKWVAKNAENVKAIIASLLGGRIGGGVAGRLKAIREDYAQGLTKQLNILQRESDKTFNKLEKNIQNWNDKTASVYKTQLSFKPGEGLKETALPGRKIENPVILAEMENRLQNIRSLEADYEAGQKAIAAQQEIINKKTGFWSNLGKNIVTSIKAIGSSLLWGAITAALSGLIVKTNQFIKRLKELHNTGKRLSEDFQKDLEDMGTQGYLVQSARRALAKNDDGSWTNEYENENYDPDKPSPDDILYTEKARKGALNIANDLLGTNYKIDASIDQWSELIKKLDEYYKELKTIHKYELSNDYIGKESSERSGYESQLRDKRPRYEKWQKRAEQWDKWLPKNMYGASSGINIPAIVAGIKGSDIKALEDAIEQIDEKMAEYAKDVGELSPQVKAIEDKKEKALDIGEVDENYAKIQNDYNKELKILKDKKKMGLLTEDEYQSELESLIGSTIDSIMSLKDITFGADEFTKSLLEAALAFKQIDALRNIETEYNEAKKKLTAEYDAGAIEQEEYNDSMDQLILKTFKAVAALGDLEGTMSKFPEDIRKAWEESKNRQAEEEEARKKTESKERVTDTINSNLEPLGKRSSTFDYKKNDAEIARENYDIWKAEADMLKGIMDSLSKDEMDMMDSRFDIIKRGYEMAIGKAEGFKQAAELGEINADIEEFQKQLSSGVVQGVNSIAEAMDRFHTAIKSLQDEDMTGFERMITIFNILIQTTETLLQTMELFSSITKIIEGLTGAEAALGEVQSQNSKKKIEDTGKEIAMNEAEAMSSAGKEAAKMPFPYNLAAVAAAIAAITGLFASIPRYEKGGIVGGNSKTGDKLLARVNSGEMILTRQQQNALLNGGGQVQFKVRGQDLIGVLSNYQKKITK